MGWFLVPVLPGLLDEKEPTLLLRFKLEEPDTVVSSGGDCL